MKRIAPLVLLASLTPAAAWAGADLESSRYAADVIANGDYGAAEAQLRQNAAERDVPALVNLAEVYRATSRAAEAQALYREILALPLEELATTNGWTRSSHTIARAGLKRIGYAGR